MAYIDGFVIAAPTADKEKFLEHARRMDAFFLEFGALIQLRKREPRLRGAFRIPVNRAGVVALAALPMIVLVGVIAISFRDGEYGFPAVVGAAVAIGLGPILYHFAQRRAG